MIDFLNFFVFLLIFLQEIKPLKTLRVLKVDGPVTEKIQTDFPSNSFYVRDFYEGGSGDSRDKPGIGNRKDNYNESGKIDEIEKKVDGPVTEKIQTDFPSNSFYVRGFYEGGSGDSDDKPGIVNGKDNYNESGKIDEIEKKVDGPVTEKIQTDFPSNSFYVRDFYERGSGDSRDKPGIGNRKDNYNESGKIDEIEKKVDGPVTEKIQTDFPSNFLYVRDFYEGGGGDRSDKQGIENRKDNFDKIGKEVDEPVTEKNQIDFPYNYRHVRNFYEGGNGDNHDKQGIGKRKDNFDEIGRKVDDPITEKIQINFPIIPLRYSGNFYEWGNGEMPDKPGMVERDDDKRAEWRQKVHFGNELHGEDNTHGHHGETNNQLEEEEEENAETENKKEIDKIKLDIMGILLAIYLKLVISTGISSVFLFLGSVIYRLAIFTGTTAVFAEDSVIQFIFKSLSIVEKYF